MDVGMLQQQDLGNGFKDGEIVIFSFTNGVNKKGAKGIRIETGFPTSDGKMKKVKVTFEEYQEKRSLTQQSL